MCHPTPLLVRQGAFRLLGSVAGLLLLGLLGANARAQESGWGSSWTNAPTDNAKANQALSAQIARDLHDGRNADAERHLAELMQKNPDAYGIAAVVHWRMRRYQAALEDSDRALQAVRERTPSAIGEVYLLRAHIYLSMKNYPASRAEDERAVRSNRDNETFNNDLAWLLATCSDAKVRDGPLAVRYAKTACEQGKYHDPEMLDTLGAAEAEAGDYPAAVQDEERAIALSRKDQLRGADKRLRLFQNHQPYHETAGDNQPAATPSHSS